MKEPNLPQGYEYLGDVVKKAQGRLRELDELIDNVQQERYDTPSPKPPGAIEPGMRGRQANEIARFNSQKEEVRANANKTIDRELKDVDPDTKRQITDHVKHQLSDGVYDTGTMKAFENKQTKFDQIREQAKNERETKDKYLSEQERENDAPPSALDNTSFGQFMVAKEVADEFERHSPEPTKEPQAKEAEKTEQSPQTDKKPQPEGSDKDAQPSQTETEAKQVDNQSSTREAEQNEPPSALDKSSFAQAQNKSDLKADHSTNAKDITSPGPDQNKDR